jgi:hypothetical protein
MLLMVSYSKDCCGYSIVPSFEGELDQLAEPESRIIYRALKRITHPQPIIMQSQRSQRMQTTKAIGQTKHFGLITFMWGDELVEKSVVDYLKKT